MPFLRQAATTAAALLSVFALTGASPAKATTSSTFRLEDPYIPTDQWDHGLSTCATPSGGRTANGTIVTAWDCNGDKSQNWHFETTSYGKFLVNNNSGRCLTPSGGGTAAGTVLTLWTCDPNKAEISQKWGQTAASGGPVVNLHSDKIMGTPGPYAPSNGTYLILGGNGSNYTPTY